MTVFANKAQDTRSPEGITSARVALRGLVPGGSGLGKVGPC